MVRGRRFLALWLSLVAVFLVPAPARALGNSALEERSVQRALGDHPDREAAPEGKRIERVEIVRLPVFDEDDPVPDFVNVFHGQTREPVIRRELLFRAGDPYRSDVILETVRNLQGLPQFGVVVVVALKGSSPDQVRVVVIVRDVWSLRLAYDLRGTFKSINYLLINPSEWNLFGTRTLLGGTYTLAPDRYSLGGMVIYPRVAGTKMDALAQGQVYVNRASDKAEGSTGQVALYRELLSLRDKWAFVTGAAWSNEQFRKYNDQNPKRTAAGVPIAYHTDVIRAGAQVTRSFGLVYKFNLTFGVEYAQRKFDRASETTPEDFATFVDKEVPLSDTRLSPFVQLEHKTAHYLATQDVETLELRESFSLEQFAALRLYPALHAAGSTRNLLGSVAWVGYTWPVDTGLLRVVANSSIEVADENRHQASAQGALRFVSPKIGGFARLVVDGALGSAYYNYLNRKLLLGGDTRPRGYVSAYFSGGSALASSLELRTGAINILSARVGAVAFYDVGGTGEQVDDIALHQSVGAGVRILLPQLNREVFRVDWAAPLTPGPGRFPNQPLPGSVYFSFGQAFEMPGTRLPGLFGAETSLLQPSR